MNIKALTYLYTSLRCTKYLYFSYVIIFICSSFLFTPQTALSLNTKKEQALKLIHSLRSEKDFIKTETIEEELIGMGPEILEVLIPVLDEELDKKKFNREFAISIIRVLNVIHDPLAVPPLLRATHFVDWIVREEAVSALVSTIDYNPTNLDMLVDILSANDSFVQNKARDTILRMELSSDNTESLIEEMQIKRDTSIRTLIVDILSVIKGDKVINHLFSLLNDSDAKVREEAVKALNKIGVINKDVDKNTLLKILDIIKDNIIFIELWEEVINKLNIPNLKDIRFLISALKVGVNAESDSLKLKVIDNINSIGEPALEELNRTLEKTRKDSKFYMTLLQLKNKIIEEAKTKRAREKAVRY